MVVLAGMFVPVTACPTTRSSTPGRVTRAVLVAVLPVRGAASEETAPPPLKVTAPLPEASIPPPLGEMVNNRLVLSPGPV